MTVRGDELLVGLDVGTTAVKAAVFDATGEEVARGRAPTPWRTVQTGAEVDPEALLAAAVAAASDALAQSPEGRVVGVGVTSMGETGVLLDAAGRPVGPTIAWHDTRGAEQAERLASDLGAKAFARRTGLAPTPLCTVVKYRWMRDHHPETARGVRWLNVAEWIVRGLGGDEIAELSLASRTGLLDLERTRPWDEALAWAEAPADLLPALAVAGTPAGSVDCDALPRAQGAVLAVGGHDHLSAAVGAGAAGDGDVLDSCGTAEAFVRASTPLDAEQVGRAVEQGISVGWHAVDGRHALMGSQWAGRALGLVLGMLGIDPESRKGIEEAALDADPGSIAVEDLDAPALALSGIGREASPAAVYRAALEAAGARGAAILERMDDVVGVGHARLVVTGGWAAGEAARLVKARHLGRFAHSAAISTGARGAALAAGRAADLWSIDDAPRAALEEVV